MCPDMIVEARRDLRRERLTWIMCEEEGAPPLADPAREDLSPLREPRIISFKFRMGYIPDHWLRTEPDWINGQIRLTGLS